MNSDLETVKEGSTRIPLYREEAWIFEKIASGLREYLKTSNPTPEQIVSVGKLLHAVQVLPLIDEVINIEFCVQLLPDSDVATLVLNVNETGVELSVIERCHHPQGSDVVCERVADFQCDGERTFGNGWSVGYWLRNWVDLLKTESVQISIYDSSGCSEPDWSLRPDSSHYLPDDEDDGN